MYVIKDRQIIYNFVFKIDYYSLCMYVLSYFKKNYAIFAFIHKFN